MIDFTTDIGDMPLRDFLREVLMRAASDPEWSSDATAVELVLPMDGNAYRAKLTIRQIFIPQGHEALHTQQ